MVRFGGAPVGLRALLSPLAILAAGWESCRRPSNRRQQALKREKLTQRQECDQKLIASRVLSSIHGATNTSLAGTW